MDFVRRTGCGMGATLPCAWTAAPLAPQPIGFEVGSELTLVSIGKRRLQSGQFCHIGWRINTASDIPQIVKVRLWTSNWEGSRRKRKNPCITTNNIYENIWYTMCIVIVVTPCSCEYNFHHHLIYGSISLDASSTDCDYDQTVSNTKLILIRCLSSKQAGIISKDINNTKLKLANASLSLEDSCNYVKQHAAGLSINGKAVWPQVTIVPTTSTWSVHLSNAFSCRGGREDDLRCSRFNPCFQPVGHNLRSHICRDCSCCACNFDAFNPRKTFVSKYLR